ncbi:hypothetical protein [Konateibacter massiliensis]|uniref:hypothetical protein n=1 Tax=Konateibacter massiliensis TaxID=2002841 RepID=UPI000C15EC5C|nr:hypothetical protein [Konateibacter massiliensis]
MELNHFTVNTKNNRVSKSEEVLKATRKNLRQTIIDAQGDCGVDVLDNTNFKLTVEENCYMGTLSVYEKDILLPILVTGGASTEYSRKYIWGEMLKVNNVLQTQRLNTILDANSIIFPTSPLIMDIVIEMVAIKHIDIMEWTGDFSKCIGHILLGSSVDFK